MIALIILPGYFLFGAAFKVLLIPYVLFLVFRQSAVFLPALLVHFLPGTLVSFSMLVACAVVAILNLQTLAGYRLKFLFFMACIPLPLLFGVTFLNLTSGEFAVVDIVEHMTLYMGLFPFFYGVVISQDYQPRVGHGILWVLLFAVLFQMSGLYEGVIRYIVFAFPVYFALGIYLLVGTEPLRIPQTLKAIPFLIFLAAAVDRSGLSTFTNLLTALTSTLLAWIWIKFRGLARSIPIAKGLGVAGVLMTIYLVGFAGDRIYNQSKGMNLKDVTSFEEIIPAFEFKAFGDRAPLWINAWNAIQRDSYFWVPLEPSEMTFETGAGVEIEISYGAHNVGLELIRNYGFLTGAVGIVVYILIFSSVGLIFKLRSFDPLLLIFGTSTIATGLVGGSFGHFVLINSFSFLLTGMAGIVFGTAFRNEFRNEKNVYPL